MKTNVKTKNLWNHEYSEGQIIPSSIREDPSHALLLFNELLQFRKMERVLDSGCGNGRNAFYLAKLGVNVDCFDFSSNALSLVSNRAKQLGLVDKICIHEGNLENGFHFQQESFDLCLDFYVFCHFLDEQIKRQYIAELWRVTKTDGFVVSTVFPPWDKYYHDLGISIHKPFIVTDPANGITKEFYTKANFKKQFSPLFEVKYFVELEFFDIVQSVPYKRNILAMALQKS